MMLRKARGAADQRDLGPLGTKHLKVGFAVNLRVYGLHRRTMYSSLFSRVPSGLRYVVMFSLAMAPDAKARAHRYLQGRA